MHLSPDVATLVTVTFRRLRSPLPLSVCALRQVAPHSWLLSLSLHIASVLITTCSLHCLKSLILRKAVKICIWLVQIWQDGKPGEVLWRPLCLTWGWGERKLRRKKDKLSRKHNHKITCQGLGEWLSLERHCRASMRTQIQIPRSHISSRIRQCIPEL